MNKNENWNMELSKYIKQGEPHKKEKAEIWETAIGLQDVDEYYKVTHIDYTKKKT